MSEIIPFEEWKIGTILVLRGYKGVCNQCFRDVEIKAKITVVCVNIFDDIAYLVTTDPALVCPDCGVRMFLIRVKHDIDVTKEFTEISHASS